MTSEPSMQPAGQEKPRSVRARDALQGLDAFTELHDVALDALAGAADIIIYGPGDTVVQSGLFDGTQLYGIVSGAARIVKPATMAGEFDVEEVSAGVVVGLKEFLAFGEAPGSLLGITALDELVVVLVDVASLEGVIRDDRAVTLTFMRYAAQQWLGANGTGDMGAGTSNRIYQYLLALAERDGASFVVAEMPRHAAIAEYCGVTDREAASAIAGLIDRGIARRDYPSLIIEDMAALRGLAY